MELQQFTTFNEVCVLAHKVEQQKKRNPFRRETHKIQPKTAPNSRAVANPYRRTVVPVPVPPRQQHPAHFPNTSAPQKANPPQTRPVQGPYNPRRFKCQGLGHIAADCPNRKVITLAEWDAAREEVVEDEPEEPVETPETEEEEEIAEADEGELLVLRRALSSCLLYTSDAADE